MDDASDQLLVEYLRDSTTSHTDMFRRELAMIDETNMDRRQGHPEAFGRNNSWYDRLLGRNYNEEQQQQQPPPPPQRRQGRQQQRQGAGGGERGGAGAEGVGGGAGGGEEQPNPQQV